VYWGGFSSSAAWRAVQDYLAQCFCVCSGSHHQHAASTTDPTPQVSGLSDTGAHRAHCSCKVFMQYRTPDGLHLVAQAAVRDPTCIPALVHTALGARHQLASITDPELHEERRDTLRGGLLLLHNLLSLNSSLHPLVGAALAAAPPATRDAKQQQQQQPGGSRACAGCGKTAADKGVDKLRRCNGCPRESALRFCSVACQRAVWVGGHRQECPRLDTAAQRDG